MNFEEAFKHYQEGVATVEEKNYVLDELAKARAFSSLFDDEGLTVTPAPLKDADVQEIRMAKKSFKWTKLAYALSSVLFVLVLFATILGSIFGTASDYANKNIVYGKTESIVYAKDFAFDLLNNAPAGTPTFVGSVNDIHVTDIEKKFVFDSALKKSYYIFRIELKAGTYSIEVDVDSRYANKCSLHDFSARD